jgi:hypothetical protein
MACGLIVSVGADVGGSTRFIRFRNAVVAVAVVAVAVAVVAVAVVAVAVVAVAVCGSCASAFFAAGVQVMRVRQRGSICVVRAVRVLVERCLAVGPLTKAVPLSAVFAWATCSPLVGVFRVRRGVVLVFWVLRGISMVTQVRG